MRKHLAGSTRAQSYVSEAGAHRDHTTANASYVSEAGAHRDHTTANAVMYTCKITQYLYKLPFVLQIKHIVVRTEYCR